MSVDHSAYLAWQLQLLAYSHAQVGQTGSFVALDHEEVVEGDDYPPYNRPFAIARWLERAKPADDDVVLHVDPDMIFVRALDLGALRHLPVADDGRYPLQPSGAAALRRYVRAPDRVRVPVVPFVMRVADLARVTPAWCSWTLRLRADDAARRALGWNCELWAFALASREVGLRLDQGYLASMPPLEAPARPCFVHYAWKTYDFDKRSYVPWADLRGARHPGHVALQDTIADFREELEVA
ncbi:MAG TPA: hypothetical protein VK501_22490 [Baekduia sp.]|uniref:hypothetical protein n=1 Tax=Baekduia sp. TaxID=2600305 RepID=UPI002C3FC835|nr:hypothetical protein [Baekduia sp.]HMJ36691.1 hypothetical protein [Baekduia sp.]